MCAWNSISIQIFKWQKIYGGLYSCRYLLWYAKYLLVIWCCHNLPNMNSHQVWEAFSLRGCPTNACLHGPEFQRPSQTEVTKKIRFFSINTHNQTNTRLAPRLIDSCHFFWSGPICSYFLTQRFGKRGSNDEALRFIANMDQSYNGQVRPRWGIYCSV